MSRTIQIRFEPELLAQLDAAAAADGVTRTQFVKDAIAAKLAARDPERIARALRHGDALDAARAAARERDNPARRSGKRRKNSTANVTPPKPGGHAGCLRVANPEAYCRGCST